MATTYIEYVIHLDDKAAVDRLQKARPLLWTPRNSPFSFANPLGGGSFGEIPARTPDMVGKVYGAPLRAAYRNWKNSTPADAPLTVLTTNQTVTPNCITSPWITASDQTTNPINKDEFTRRKGGFWSWITCWFTDCDETYIWAGRFEYAPSAPVVTPGPGGPTPVAAIQQRKWIDGFEHPLAGEAGSGGSAEAHTRAASRHTDGYGFMLRSSAGALRTHACVESGAAVSSATWERFYIRPRGYPTAKVPFWRCRGSISNTSGMQLCMESTGRISLNDTDGFDVMTPVGTTAAQIPLDEWARIDVVFSFPTAGVFPTSAGSYFELWINGVLSVNLTAMSANLQVQTHTNSEVGHGAGYNTRNLGLDIDDWMAATVPDRDISKRTGNDWKNGSKVAPIEATAIADSSSGTFTGNYRIALQEPADDATMFFTTAVGSDVLGLKTNAEKVIEGTPGAIGAAALIVCVHSERSGTGNGAVGYSVNGAAVTYVASVDNVIRKWSSALLRPAGALAPTTMTPLEIFRKSSATVTVEKVYTFAAAAELLGVFGNEDVVPDSTGAKPVVVNNTGIHCAPYPRTAWAKASDIPAVAPVAVIAGTYVGNSDGQDLVFQFPPTWLIIRNVTDGTDGVFWWSSLFSSHHLFRNEIESCGAVQILVDPDFEVVTGTENDQMQRYLVRIVGNQANSNLAGKTYSYTAFCDPGQRFTVNGQLTWPRGATDRTTKLYRSTFTPDAAWFFREQILGSTNVEVFYKGRGHATEAGSKIDAAETAALVKFGKGIITTKSALTVAGHTAIGFAAWRRSDGSGDPGLPKVVQIFSYTGNGAGNRDIPFDVVSLVRPLWAMIVPHNGEAIYRDSEHTGTGSTKVPTTTDALNGIRGGDIDIIKVGSDLNTAAIVYDVFLIPGGTAACNNGWSCPGTFVPIPPIPPPGPGPTGCDPITLAPATLPAGKVGEPYIANLTASGGLAPYTFAVTNGTLPAGLALSAGGAITGTPTSPLSVSFTVRATDAGEDGCFGDAFYSISFNADTCPDVVLAPAELPTAVVGTPYTASISASGGAAPYVFTISNGALPAGFTLSAGGALAGTLASTSVSPFTVRATDINGCFGEMLYSLVPDDIGGGVGCVAASLDIVNRALSRIGITKPIVDLLNDKTVEATTARLNYNNDVDTVLRDFPWPFATKYAALVKVAGTTSARLNADWTFSYRQPNGCLFERRIVVARGAGVDPVPPPFQLSSDTVGGLILTNQDAAVLEFTARPNCAALRGDSLFRDALTWRHALSLAPALTRMTDVAKNAEEQYAKAIELARAVLRQGNPGAPAAAATIDTSVSAIAANLAVVNRALVWIGANTIANLSTDQSREARASSLVFEEELRATLRELPWPFATGYATLAKVAGPTPPANPDWTYSYRRPADSIFERRIVLERKGALDPTPPPFALASDGAGGLVLTNQADAVLEYTRRPDATVNLADGLFREAFAWRLAATLAPSLAQRAPDVAEQLGRGPDPAREVEQPNVQTPAASGVQLRATAAAAAWAMYQQTIMKARGIHRPGTPGLPPAEPTIDTCGSCQQANVAAVNRALARIGARTIRDLTSDQSREATQARLVFEDELRATLYDFPWPFATRFANLSVMAGPAPPARPDWLYAYRQPDDCLFERRLVAERGDAVDPTPPAFQLASDAAGGLVLTNQADAVLEYTARPDGAVMRGDMLFRDAFAWRLAAALAPSLGPVDPDQVEQVGRGPDVDRAPERPEGANQGARRNDAAYAWQQYMAVLAKAHTVLKPGTPGLPASASTIDTSASAKAANTTVVNRALVHIGAQTIVQLATDQSRPAVAARLVFEEELRGVLWDLPWPFATQYAALVLDTLPAAAAGEWQYAYRQPADCVFERRLVKDRAGAIDPVPPPFQLTSDATGGLILTNEANATLEYTARVEAAVLRGDRLFREALTWRLAAVLAPSLAPVDPEATEQKGRDRDLPEQPDSKPAKRQTARVDASYAWRMYRDTLTQARDLIVPGVPGLPTGAPLIDVSAAAQLANTQVVNRALVRIGAQSIRALLTDPTREAATARNVFEDELQSCLRDHPWAFATGYIKPTLAAGSPTSPINADWIYGYRLPAGTVFVRRVAPVSATGRGWDPNPILFRLGQDTTGPLLFVNDVDPNVEITTRPEGAVALADALFRDALAWRLAAALAPSLATVDPTKAEQSGRAGDGQPDREPKRVNAAQRIQVARWAWDRYNDVLDTARTRDANEQQQDPKTGDADWITGRN